jgi:glycosyltransferase involved in cell wall biosynthesis
MKKITTSPKKISVIITCYNLEKYLDECIDSIKQQIKPADEIILVHDGCKETAKAYTGVTTVFCDKNIGVARSRDLGFKISTGSHIIFFDADDKMPLNYLKELSEVDADVVYPNCVLWSGWGNSGNKNIWHESPNKIIWKKMLIQNEVIMPSLFKREWYNKVGGFDDSLQMFEDYDFWLKMLDKGAIFKKSSAFMYYRQRTLSRNHQFGELKVEIYKKITEKFTLNSEKPSKV